MTKLEIAKQVIKQHVGYAEHGIFDVRNFVNDPMTNVYLKDGLQIDICYHHGYFEVFGLTCDEFSELARYYYCLLMENGNGRNRRNKECIVKCNNTCKE